MSTWAPLRTVVEDSAASEAADSFSAGIKRFGEAYEGMKWLLCRTPDMGISNGEGQHLLIQASDPLAGTPVIAAIYSFSDDEVVIHEIKTFDPPEGDEQN